MALIPIVAEYFTDPFIQLIVILSTFGIGLSQGIFLGRAILIRFPRLQNHLKTVSVSLFVLFLINTVLSVPRFQSPEKIELTNLHGIVKGFVFFFSSLLLIFTALSRFTDLTPSSFEVLLYFLYQLGITIGILFGTIRKIKPPKLDLK